MPAPTAPGAWGIWQPWQTFLKIASPPCSVKPPRPPPAPAPWAKAPDVNSRPSNAAEPRTRQIYTGFIFPSGFRSSRHDTLMQTPDRVQRGNDRTFLPGAQMRGMFAGQDHTAIDCAECIIVLFAIGFCPLREAAQG